MHSITHPTPQAAVDGRTPRRRTPRRIALLLVALTAVCSAAACQPATVPELPETGPADPTTTTTTVAISTTTSTAAPTTTTTGAPTTTTTTTTVAPSSVAAPVAPAGFTYVGGDEFATSALDATRWRAYHNSYGDANGELACLTPANLAASGGVLTITARKQAVSCPGGSSESYTSGFIGSREAGRYYPRYGRYEIRARLPHAQGLWPAFWLRHRNGAGVAEVDIMEYFHSQVPGKTTQTLHLDGVSNISKKTAAFEAPTATPGWHTWAVDIAPDPGGVRFTFLMDGSVTHTFVDAKHAWTSADPEATWDIAVNLAVGGRWVGGPDDTLGYLRDLNRCSIAGTAPDGCSSAGIRRVDWGAARYQVDYVRVFRRA